VSNKQRWVVLLGLLALIALIQILPQVDLPDIAFRRGQTPVVIAFAHVSSPVLIVAYCLLLQHAMRHLLRRKVSPLIESRSTFEKDCVVVLLSTFRC
jgi:hypothetical protein